jgi:glycine cleavage system aminomethyltransferase T
MSPTNLQDLLDAADSPVTMLRNSQSGPNVYPGIQPEYTNWRDEQRAWQESCVLFHQTFHMADLNIKGPGAMQLLSDTGINSFANFPVDRAKQFVPVTPDGYVIGDVILFHLAEEEFNLVGRAPVLNWLTYQAEKGGYDVELAFDQRTALRTDGKRVSYRFQVQGPNAMDALGKALGTTPPELKFFNMTTVDIAGHQVRALRHGMAGQPGWELFGPYEEYDEVLAALLEAGRDFGMHEVGARAYSSNALESAWVPSPLPAIYHGEELRAYREWLPATGYEANASLGGSLLSDRIEDYYFTPWDLTYGGLIKFDHDFIGRDALAAMADQEHRQKVTLALEDEDVDRVLGTLFTENRAKFIDCGRGRRGDRRGLDVDRLQLQRAQDADPGHARAQVRRARYRGDAGLGRGERRDQQAHGREPRADRDPRHRQSRPLCQASAQRLRARRLACRRRLRGESHVGERSHPRDPPVDRRRGTRDGRDVPGPRSSRRVDHRTGRGGHA